jgi:hypothetical protein
MLAKPSISSHSLKNAYACSKAKRMHVVRPKEASLMWHATRPKECMQQGNRNACSNAKRMHTAKVIFQDHDSVHVHQHT